MYMFTMEIMQKLADITYFFLCSIIMGIMQYTVIMFFLLRLIINS
jgi:hypothetical protein